MLCFWATTLFRQLILDRSLDTAQSEKLEEAVIKSLREQKILHMKNTKYKHVVSDKNRYKRLEPESWVSWDVLENDDAQCKLLGTAEYPEIAPKFGRDGYYFDRAERKTWIEFGGRAWAYNEPKQFLYELEYCYPHRMPRRAVIAALLDVERENRKLLSPSAKLELDVWKTWVSLRGIRVGRRHNVSALFLGSV